MFGDKPVVSLVELLPSGFHIAFVSGRDLRAQASPHGIAHPDHSADAGQALDGQPFQDLQMVSVTNGDLLVHQRVGIGFDMFGCREQLLRGGSPHCRALRVIDSAWQQRDSLSQALRQGSAITHQRRLSPPIHAALQPHLAHHHLRVRGEILIDDDGFVEGVGDLRGVLPRRPVGQFTRQTFAQDNDVGGDLGVGVLLEGVVGQTDGPKQVSLVGNILTQCAVEFVQCALGRDEQNQPPGPHFLQRGGEEVVMDDEVPLLEARIVRVVIAEGDIGNGHVIEAIGELRLLEWLMPEIGVGVE